MSQWARRSSCKGLLEVVSLMALNEITYGQKRLAKYNLVRNKKIPAGAHATAWGVGKAPKVDISVQELAAVV